MGPQRNTWIASSIPTFRSPLNLNSAPSSPGYRRSAVQVCITSQGRGRRACTAWRYSIQRPWPTSKEPPVQLDPGFAAPNADGRRAQRTAGLACAGTVGIPLTPGESVRHASISGKSPSAPGAGHGLHTQNGTHRNEARARRTASANLIFVIIGSNADPPNVQQFSRRAS